jgi:hypothetical protein
MAITALILGVVVGSALGHILGTVLPEGPVKTFFLQSLSAGFGPVHLDLAVLTFDIGIRIKINFISVLGAIALAYFLRWFY